MSQIIERLQDAEGFRSDPYDDADGKTLETGDKVHGVVTFGYGFTYITKDEAGALLRRRVNNLRIYLSNKQWYTSLDMVRSNVIIEMAFNMGLTGMLSFHKMIGALQRGDTTRAADEIEDSLAYRQLPERYGELRDMMRTGEFIPRRTK